MFYFALKQFQFGFFVFVWVFLFAFFFIFKVRNSISHCKRTKKSSSAVVSWVFCPSVRSGVTQANTLAACSNTTISKRKEKDTWILGYDWEKFSLVQHWFFLSSLESSLSVCCSQKWTQKQAGRVSRCWLRGDSALPLTQLLCRLLAVPCLAAEAAGQWCKPNLHCPSSVVTLICHRYFLKEKWQVVAIVVSQVQCWSDVETYLW